MSSRQDDQDAADLIHAGGATGVPIDIAVVTREHGIDLRTTGALPDTVGGLYYHGPIRDVILINSHHSRVRQRFSIAHELAHWYFRHTSGLGVSFTGIHHLDINDAKREAEREVDAFAAKLLMPIHLLLDELSDCQDIGLLARRFNVSRAAMRRRLCELDLDPSNYPLPQRINHPALDLSDPAWEVCQLSPDDDFP